MPNIIDPMNPSNIGPSKLIRHTIQESASSSYPIAYSLIRSYYFPSNFAYPLPSIPLPNPPLQMEIVMPWKKSCSLNVRGHLGDVINKSWDDCTKFRGDDSPTEEKHLDNFIAIYGKFNIAKENVIVILFVHSFEAKELQ